MCHITTPCITTVFISTVINYQGKRDSFRKILYIKTV